MSVVHDTEKAPSSGPLDGASPQSHETSNHAVEGKLVNEHGHASNDETGFFAGMSEEEILVLEKKLKRRIDLRMLVPMVFICALSPMISSVRLLTSSSQIVSSSSRRP
jgi:hypothetical protein